MDAVCIQEPWTWPGSRTQTHPGYDYYTPIDSWSEGANPTDPRHLIERPRVITYVRKGASLATQQRNISRNRDMLLVVVNGYSIINIYREPNTDTVIDYITITPPRNTLIGGDFNVWHSMFEPGANTAGRGGDVAEWSITSGMDYVGTSGEATHRRGHVIDLSFSNIPFTRTSVHRNLHSGSDHETLVTVIPERGAEAHIATPYRVADAALGRFSGLVHIGATRLGDPRAITNTRGIDEYVEGLEAMLKSAISTAGKQTLPTGKTAVWWSDEIHQLHREHLRLRERGQDSRSQEQHDGSKQRSGKQRKTTGEAS